MTLHDFVRQNKVEVTMDEHGVYNCYINYRKGDAAWGKGSNILEAIDVGVINFLKALETGKPSPEIRQKLSEDLRLFLTKDALFIWYFYAKKYNIEKIVTHYEQMAQDKHPAYLEALRFIYDTVNAVIDNPELEIMKDYAAINNVFIQALVYYHSLKIEKYENNTLIRKMVDNLKPDDRDAFYRIQSTIETIDKEIQSLIE